VNQEHFSILLYMFSSFIQADAAMFAIFGVFVVYRLQGLDTDFDRNWEILLGNAGRMFPDEVTAIELAATTEERAKALKILDKPPYASVVRRLILIPDARAALKDSIQLPTAILVIHLLLSCFGLAISGALSRSSDILFYFVTFLMSCVFLAIVTLLVMVVKKSLLNSIGELASDSIPT